MSISSSESSLSSESSESSSSSESSESESPLAPTEGFLNLSVILVGVGAPLLFVVVRFCEPVSVGPGALRYAVGSFNFNEGCTTSSKA